MAKMGFRRIVENPFIDKLLAENQEQLEEMPASGIKFWVSQNISPIIDAIIIGGKRVEISVSNPDKQETVKE